MTDDEIPLDTLEEPVEKSNLILELSIKKLLAKIIKTTKRSIK